MTTSRYNLCSVFSCVPWDDELNLECSWWPKVYMCQSKLFTKRLTFPLLSGTRKAWEQNCPVLVHTMVQMATVFYVLCWYALLKYRKSSKIAPPFASHFEAKVGRGMHSNIEYSPVQLATNNGSVFQDREQSSQSPYLQSRVVLLHLRRATDSVWGWQYSGWLCCTYSYPGKLHDDWPRVARNIQSLLVLSAEEW